MRQSIGTLRIEGFKSFFGAAELHFSPGVSVLVGRNGSGKSNVTDALRWALGEEDLRALRVRALGELVSVGGLPAAERADVTVTLVAGEGRPDRTVHRWTDGQRSEWTVDGVSVGPGPGQVDPGPLRLRTVIRQGEVGRLLWLHPEERARLFASALAQPPATAAPEAGSPAAVLDRALRARVPAAERPLFERVVQALDRVSPDGGSGRGGQAFADGGAGEEPFVALHRRVQDRFRRYFSTLIPGGTCTLPLAREPASGRWQVGLQVRFPHRARVPLSSLSGGQLVMVGLCLALAYFLEVPSPALVLDEVEPALDETMVRRLSSLLRAVSVERQVILVSHQRLIRDTAGTVFELRRHRDRGSTLWFRYDPRELRAPGSGH